jgi:hypothetical protein
VADGGSRVYIVGGRAGSPSIEHPAVGSDVTSTRLLCAEVFELSLGDDPLSPFGSGARWRQVHSPPPCVPVLLRVSRMFASLNASLRLPMWSHTNEIGGAKQFAAFKPDRAALCLCYLHFGATTALALPQSRLKTLTCTAELRGPGCRRLIHGQVCYGWQLRVVLQVTVQRHGATWMSSRASPSCHVFNINGKEQLLAVGGYVVNVNFPQATATAVLFELSSSTPGQSFEREEGLTRLFRLKEVSEGELSWKVPARGLSGSSNMIEWQAKFLA